MPLDGLGGVMIALFWWKQPESEEDLLEHRTNGTDAFETLYIGCEKFPQYDLYPIAIGGHGSFI